MALSPRSTICPTRPIRCHRLFLIEPRRGGLRCSTRVILQRRPVSLTAGRRHSRRTSRLWILRNRLPVTVRSCPYPPRSCRRNRHSSWLRHSPGSGSTPPSHLRATLTVSHGSDSRPRLRRLRGGGHREPQDFPVSHRSPSQPSIYAVLLFHSTLLYSLYFSTSLDRHIQTLPKTLSVPAVPAAIDPQTSQT